ncbi:homoserine O-acetyltransferase [Paenibacillus sp. SI8]|uniref:homoserine O-acetyltransferase MetX n=1 Tax=unclassified Paenibacillus TaxID=185978 RepID=UPI0034660DB5
MFSSVQIASFPKVNLESGKQLEHVRVAYETYGTLNESRDNCIWICHALTGDAHAAGGTESRGWWEGFIGPGKAIDTDYFYVVSSNVLGGCMGTTGPSSLNPETGEPYGLSFPVVTIRDMVEVQKMLLGKLQVTDLAAVVGGSMGGMQALEWAIMFPEIVHQCILIATTLQFSAMGIAYNDIARQAIISDPEWREGNYYRSAGPVKGLSIARMLGMVKYGTREIYNQRFSRALAGEQDELDFWSTYQVESYLRHQGEKLVQRFDANSYLYLLKAMDTHDICRGRGTLDEVLRKTQSSFIVISINTDSFYPSREHQELVQRLHLLQKSAEYFELESAFGHDAFLIETVKLSQFIRPLLLNQPIAPNVC